MIYDGDCEAIDGMRIGRGNRSTRRKPAPVPLYPPYIPYDVTRARTGGRPATERLSYDTALPSVRPVYTLIQVCSEIILYRIL
jgi:hypothetical protein